MEPGGVVGCFAWDKEFYVISTIRRDSISSFGCKRLNCKEICFKIGNDFVLICKIYQRIRRIYKNQTMDLQKTARPVRPKVLLRRLNTTAAKFLNKYRLAPHSENGRVKR